MRRCGLTLVLVALLATSCAAGRISPGERGRDEHGHTSGESTASASSLPEKRSTSSPVRSASSPRRARSRSSSPGFTTSLGKCGPTAPLTRQVYMVEVMPDGTQPTCASIGPGQELAVSNMTRAGGSPGCTLHVSLPDSPKRTLIDGKTATYHRTGQRLLRHRRVTLRISGDCSGSSAVTLWRVDRDGHSR